MFQKLGRKTFLYEVSLFAKRFQSTAHPHYDIIVAGGGMVGTTLACTLSKNDKLLNKKILFLHGGKKTQFNLPPNYSNRVSALNPATFNLLNDIGAWKHIESARYGVAKRLQVWDACSDAAISFDRDDLPVVYVVENNVLLDAVEKELDKVDVVYENKIQNCKAVESEEKVSVFMDNGAVYTCDLLLGCDGANSLVRKSMNIHHISNNYNHMGIVATLKLPEDSSNVVAWQRHLPNSCFLALLPLAQGFSSMVWSVSLDEAKKLMQLPEDQFVDAINDAFWKVYPRAGFVDQALQTFDNFIRFFNLPSSSMKQCPPKVLGCDLSSRAMFPLGWSHATNYVTKGVALVGDAAHRIHPLAGQGVNLGFGDVICLNRVLGEAAYSGSHIGSLLYLKEYETERQRHNIPVMLAVHGLFQLYSSELTPLVLLRGLGLQATNAVSPLKKLLISQASGLRYTET